MVRDNKIKMKNHVERMNKKKVENDSDSGIESDSTTEDLDTEEYKKFIAKLFPSKYMKEKIKDIKQKNKNKINQIKKKKSKYIKEKEKKIEVFDDEYDDDDSDYEESEEDDEEEDDEDEEDEDSEDECEEDSEDECEEDSEQEEEESDREDKKKSCRKKNAISPIHSSNRENEKLNIIFTIGTTKNNDSEFEEESTEDEDESVSSDEEENNNESIDDKESSNKKKTKNKSKNESISPPDNEVLKQLQELLLKNPEDKSIKKCMTVYENSMKENDRKNKKKELKQKTKNMRIFRKIIKDKNLMNDFSFYEKLDLNTQNKLIKELKELNKIMRIEKPYRMTLLEADIPIELKATAMKKINSLRHLEPGSGEYYKIKNWVDTFMRIPFVKHLNLPITMEDGIEKCHEFMENSQKILDDAVYGLNDAKMQIMQLLGQLITNPKAIGTAIAIHGPPGTGKTSLIKEGISKILNRPFAFIALGGATDSSFLEGHGYTYEGSTWGKIVQILIESKCMNPVIYFDELDKISDTPRGEEIAGILTHLTDTTQNSEFHDKYFAEVKFDLSKCLFIFSYNDESKINPILKDRMYRIKTKGYNSKEKTVISNNYLLPKICEQVKFKQDDIIISDEVISHIIESHCHKEDGVRNLKRCLEIIYTKLNLYRLMKHGTNLFECEMTLIVEYPFTVTKEIADKLIKKEDDNRTALWNMYV
jgi:ATP-dependent Lon protease